MIYILNRRIRKYSIHERNNARNGIGIVVDKDLKERIFGLKRLDDRLIAIKLVLRKIYNILHFVSAYEPHARLAENIKR